MANTFKFGNGEWARKTGQVLAYNSENDNYKPLPFTFDRASSATRVNKEGLIETVATDEPRIDFLNNSKGHLLLEPQRQNLVEYSEDISNAWWLKQTFGTGVEASVASTSELAPDGSTNAFLVTLNSGSGTTPSDQAKVAKNIVNLSQGTNYTESIYLKGVNGGEQVLLGISNIGTLKVTLTTEWQRFVLSGTSGGGFNQVGVNIRRGLQEPLNSYAQFYMWGSQFEEGSYATSYIPTSGSAVTRSAEIPFGREDMVDLNLYSSEMTWFYDINLFYREGGTTVAPRLINTSNSQVFIGVNAPQSPNTDLRIRHKDGTTPLNTNAVTFTNGGRFKIAVKITGTTGTAYINGTNVGTFTTLAASNYDKYENAQNNPNNINDMRFYNTALSDSELETLTTL